MLSSAKTRWAVAIVLSTVGLVAAIGYLAAGDRLKGALSRNALAGGDGGHGAEVGQGDQAHGDAANGGHSHGGDGPTVSVTLWAKKTDIFLERPYAVVGQPVDALVHVTITASGSPVTTGRVTFQATGAGQTSIEARADRPTRPGIFIPKVTFPKPGGYRARVVIESSQVEGGGETIELPEVKVYANSAEALAAAEENQSKQPADAISFLKEQQWRVGLTTTPAAEQELVERLVVPGRVIVPPGSGAIVSTPVTGRVAPPSPEGFQRVGTKVNEGQVLAVVEPSVAGAEAVQLVANQAQLQTLDADLAVKQLEIETKIRSAELALARAKQVRDRRKKLTEEGVSAAKDLTAAEHELSLTQTELEGLRQVLRPYIEARERLAKVLGQMQSAGSLGDEKGDLRVTLRSPLGGTIVEAKATSGELIGANQPIFRIVNVERLWIEAEVSEYDLARVQQAPGASYRLAAYPDRVMPIFSGGGVAGGQPEAAPRQRNLGARSARPQPPGATPAAPASATGRLVDIGVVVDPDTRTVAIRYEVPNPDGLLRVGMFAELLVETNHRLKALAVPKQAVVDESGETVVYVQRAGETFERRRVELGIRDADLVEIRSGLAAGQRVATKGAYAVRLSTLSSAIPAHGHAH